MFRRPYYIKAFFQPTCVLLTLVAFVFTTVFPSSVLAQFSTTSFPQPNLTVPVTSALMWGMRFSPENPFKFDFIIQKGADSLRSDKFRQESEEIIKYFLTGLTIPDDQLWVNLSPYESDRIVPEDLGQTQMGHDLLLQDYLLKQLTASLVNPDTELGKKFWDKVYQRSFEEFGTTNIPVNTFNKVWILPKKASVYVSGNAVFITQSEFKVMLEKDYLASQKNKKSSDPSIDSELLSSDKASDLSSQIVRQILIPEIENEINNGKNFAQLRQIYHSLILSFWFKKNLRQSIVNRIYSDQKKISGVNIKDPATINKIYDSYVDAFKKGVCEKIKVSYDPYQKKFMSRQYFSGGSDLNLSGTLTQDTSFRTQERLSALASAGDLVNEPTEIIMPKKQTSASPLKSTRAFKTFFATMVLSVVLSLSTPYLNFASGDVSRLENDPRLKTEMSTQTSISEEIVSRPGTIGAEDKALLQQFVSIEDIARLDGEINPVTQQTYQIDTKYFEHNLDKVLQSNVFGWGYETVVLAAQHKLGLSEDGDLGPQTRKALMDALSVNPSGEEKVIAIGQPPEDTSHITITASGTDTIAVSLEEINLQQMILDDTAAQSQIAIDTLSNIISGDQMAGDTIQLESIWNADIRVAIEDTLREAHQVSAQDPLFWEQIQPRVDTIFDSIEFQDHLVRDIVQRISESQSLEAINLILIPSTIPSEMRILLERMRSIRQTYLKSLFDKAALPIIANPPEKDTASIQDVVADTVKIFEQVKTVLNTDSPVEGPEMTILDPETGLPITRREYFDRFDRRITIPTIQMSTPRDTVPMTRISPKVAQLYQLAIDTITLTPRRSYPVSPLPYLESDTVVQAINDYQEALMQTVADTLAIAPATIDIEALQNDTLMVVLSDYPEITDTLAASNDSVPSKTKIWMNKYFSFKNLDFAGSLDWWQIPTPSMQGGGSYNKAIFDAKIHPFGDINPLYMDVFGATKRSGGQLTRYYDPVTGDYVEEVTPMSYDITLTPRFGLEFSNIKFLDGTSIDIGYQKNALYAKAAYEREFSLGQAGMITVGADGQIYWLHAQKKVPIFLSLPTEFRIKNFIVEGGVNLLAMDGQTLLGYSGGIGYGSFYARYEKAFELSKLNLLDRQGLNDVGFFQMPYLQTVRVGANFSDNLQGGVYFGIGDFLGEKSYGFELHALIGNSEKKFHRSRPLIPGIRNQRLLRIMDAVDVDFEASPEYITGVSSEQKVKIFHVPFSATTNIWQGLSLGIKGFSSFEKFDNPSDPTPVNSFQIFPTLAYDFSDLATRSNEKLQGRLTAQAQIAGKALGLKAGYSLFDLRNQKGTLHFKTDADGQLWLVSLDGTKGIVPILSLSEEFAIKNHKFIFNEDIIVKDGIAWFGKIAYENKNWKVFLDFPIFGGRFARKDFMNHIDGFDPFKWQAGLTVPLHSVTLDVSIIGQGKDRNEQPLLRSVSGFRFKLNIPITKPKKSSSGIAVTSAVGRLRDVAHLADQLIDLDKRPNAQAKSYGGINLSERVVPLTSSGELPQEFDLPTELNDAEWGDFDGFIPVIINIVPIANFNLFLSSLSQSVPIS